MTPTNEVITGIVVVVRVAALFAVLHFTGLLDKWFGAPEKYTVDQVAAIKTFETEIAKRTGNRTADDERWPLHYRLLSAKLGGRIPAELHQAFFNARFDLEHSAGEESER